MKSLPGLFSGSRVAPVLLILCLGGLLLFARLGNRPLGGSEGRWGEAAREMMQTGDLIVPRINGIPYRDKPPASYWLIVLASLSSGRVSETTTRLPSAAATLLSILLIYLIAGSYWDRKAALLAALIFMTTYPLLRWSRTANADTLTLAGMLASVYFFVMHRKHVEKGFWLYPFFIIAGLTSLMKGLLGFVLPSLGVFPYLLVKNRYVVFRKKFLLHFLLSGVLGGVLFLIPFFLDFRTTHSGMSLYLVFKENILRFFRPFDHTDSFFYYFYYIFITLSPWTVLIPVFFTALKKKDFIREEGTFFFALWFVCLFAFFTLSGSKRGYYLLPVITPFSILLGFTLVRSALSEKYSKMETAFWLFPGIAAALSGILLLLLPFTALPEKFPHIAPVVQRFLYPLTGGLFLAGVSTIIILKRNFLKGFCFLFAGIYFSMSVFFWFIAPAVASLKPFAPFCEKVNTITKNTALAVYGAADRSILYFYLDKVPIPYFSNPVEAKRFLETHPRAFLLVRGQNGLNSLAAGNVKIVVSEVKGNPDSYFLITRQTNP
jgi:4-amino-4-deoxy-L-arabinose transferase-like glycosyltransferase